MLTFLLPAAFCYFAGLGVSAWDLVRRQGSLFTPSAPCFAGLALIVPGLALLLIAAATLRRSYSATLIIREDHRLITHGIYRLVRHPIYLGAIMVCIGVPVYVSSLYGIVPMSLLIPLFLHRIKVEERMLADEYGDAYRGYRKATSKLIPFLY